MIAKCGLCGQDIGKKHDCPVKLLPEEAPLLHALVDTEFCDHYCCGLTPWVCKLRAFQQCLKDSDYTFQISPVESSLESQILALLSLYVPATNEKGEALSAVEKLKLFIKEYETLKR